MKTFLGIITLLASLSTASVAVAANGAGRGGGNSIVCFSDQSIADSLIVVDPKTGLVVTYKPIPDAAVSQISTIESFDLYLAKMKRGANRASRKVIDFTLGNQDSLDQLFIRYGKRFEGKFTDLQRDLNNYADLLAFKDAYAYQYGLNPVYDIPMVGLLAPNCVLATTFVQTGIGQSAAWGFDERLFYHPKQSRLSQVAFLLHERLYLKARTEKEATDSYFVTQLVGKILDADTTFAQLFSDFMKIDSHNKLGEDAVDEIDWAPFGLLISMHYDLNNAERRGGKSEALKVYLLDYREKLLAQVGVEPAFLHTVDEATINFYSGVKSGLISYRYELLDYKIP